MIVGTAISQLIEQPGKAMRFDLEEMESDEARWYLDLLKVQDGFGSLDSIKPEKDVTQKTRKPAETSPTPMVSQNKPRANQQSKIVAIEEVEDSGSEGVEEIPYENPGDEATDSDDDPTLVKRTKPTPPV